MAGRDRGNRTHHDQFVRMASPLGGLVPIYCLEHSPGVAPGNTRVAIALPNYSETSAWRPRRESNSPVPDRQSVASPDGFGGKHKPWTRRESNPYRRCARAASFLWNTSPELQTRPVAESNRLSRRRQRRCDASRITGQVVDHTGTRTLISRVASAASFHWTMGPENKTFVGDVGLEPTTSTVQSGVFCQLN